MNTSLPQEVNKDPALDAVAQELPPLPEPARTDIDYNGVAHFYTAEQMHAYARAAQAHIPADKDQAAQVAPAIPTGWDATLRDEITATFDGIAKANWREWEELASPNEFVQWAQRRARHMLTLIAAAPQVLPNQKEGA